MSDDGDYSANLEELQISVALQIQRANRVAQTHRCCADCYEKLPLSRFKDAHAIRCESCQDDYEKELIN